MVYLFKANINFEITGRDRRRLRINELKTKTIKSIKIIILFTDFTKAN